jgi:repressor LexA
VVIIVNAVAKRKQAPPGFGRRLRVLRESAGLTQRELGEKVGMPHQSIVKYETGVNEPVWSTAVKLADALGVDVGAFREPSTPN